jgi:hypothetical protein
MWGAVIVMLQALGKLIGRYRFTRAYYAEAVASAAATNHAYSDAGCLRQLVDDSVEEQLKRGVSAMEAHPYTTI